MAQEVELEQFRSKWRKEFMSHNDSLPHPKNIPPKKTKPLDPFDSTKQQTSWKNVDDSKESEDRAASLLSQVTENVSNVVYHPFVIVGQLLKEGSCPNLSKKTNRTDLERQTPDKRSRPLKRSYFDLVSESGDETDGRDEKKMKRVNRDEGKRRESFIDYLVADLDEINEIPFFEISLARELALKIFQYLDLKDLCQCAQVSKSWQSLSEDNWLWYNVYCQQGKTKIPPMIEENSWKSVVMEEHQRQKTLLNNWKMRLGRVKSLLYVQGGALSAAALHKDTVVAGYTNGQVKLHNLHNGDVCVFQPSDMSLQLDNTCEEGTVANDITTVDTTDTMTVAVFKHGFVDIWLNDGDLKPCHTIHCGTNISAVSLTETRSDALVAVATGPHVIFEATTKTHREEKSDDGEVPVFQRLVKTDFTNKVSTIKFLPSIETSCTFDCKLAVAANHTVKIYTPPRNNEHNTNSYNSVTAVLDSENSTEIQNMYGTPITCMEVSGGSQPMLAVGLGSSTGLFDGYQDCLLPHVENGTFILLGATTENPSFHVNSALLSRCHVVVLEKLKVEEVSTILLNAVESLNLKRFSDTSEVDKLAADKERRPNIWINDKVIEEIAFQCDGDGRVALNCLQMAVQSQMQKIGGASVGANDDSPTIIDVDCVKESLERSCILYDKKGEEHYNCASALQKSIRGSDPDAALYWMARMLEGGEDPLFVARRLVRTASEDIGLADPLALNQAVAAFQATTFIGMPDCDVILAQCAVYLARAPKSFEACSAYNKAKQCIHEHKGPLPSVPLRLRKATTGLMKSLGYGRGYVPHGPADPTQSYLPPELSHMKFLQ